MVALNFKTQFVGAVESGSKTQAIRKPRVDGWIRVGIKLQLYTGMRTKKARRLGQATVTSVENVVIHRRNIFLNEKLLPEREALEIAKADGFENIEEMAIFFENIYKKLPFKGHLIKWRLDD